MILRIFTTGTTPIPASSVLTQNGRVVLRFSAGTAPFVAKPPHQAKTDSAGEIPFESGSGGENRSGLVGMDEDSGKEGMQAPEIGETVPDKVDAIRELLFGEQMEGYENRFAELEKQIDERFQNLEQGIREQLEQLREEWNARVDKSELSNVKRDKLASQLEKLAAALRDRSL